MSLSASVASASRLTASPTVSVRSPRSVLKSGALLTTVTGFEVDGALRDGAVVHAHGDADEVAAIAVARGREVQRRARGARDVRAVAAPLVARGERIAVAVVARDVRRERLIGQRDGRRDRDGVDDRRDVGGRRDRPGERVRGREAAVADGHRDRVGRRCRQRAADDTGGGSDRGARGQTGGAVGQRVGVGVGRIGIEVGGVAHGVGAILEVRRHGRRAVDDRDRGRGDGRAVGRAVVHGDAHVDLIAAIAVARGREVQRRARGADDVETRATSTGSSSSAGCPRRHGS